VLPIAVVPYVRRTQQGSYTAKARAYHENQNSIAAGVLGFLSSPWRPMPWPKGKRLAFGCSFWIAPVTTPVSRGGKTFNRTYRPAEIQDLSNLEKAVEDACNGLLYHDDRQVWRRLPGSKETADHDELIIVAYGLGG
jgi:hypothetical protein